MHCGLWFTLQYDINSTHLVSRCFFSFTTFFLLYKLEARLGVNSIDCVKDAFSCTVLFSYYYFFSLKKDISISFPLAFAT